MPDKTKNAAERMRERQMFNALCVNYTAAYFCDLMADSIEPVKQEKFSHCTQWQERLREAPRYSDWIRYAYDTFVIRESAPDYLEVFDAQNLMERLRTQESFVCRHKTLPNGAGMEYFEATVVRLYADEDSFQVIMGYRPIDDIVAEEKKRQAALENEVAALRNIHEALGSGAWKLEYNERCEMTACWWSDTMRHMLGFTSEEDFPNRFESWSDRLHPNDREYTLQEYSATVRDYSSEKTYDVEYRVRAKDGTYHWFRAAGRLSRREDGSPIAFDGVFINTDEKHKTTQRLRRALQEAEAARNELMQEHEVLSAVTRSFYSIYSIDLKEDLCEAVSSGEHAVHRLTGRRERAQAKLNTLCSTLVAEDYQKAVARFFDLSTLAERMGSADTIENEYLAQDGNWHQVRFIEKNRDESGRVANVLFVTRIVSERKRRELEQERLQVAYQAAERANAAKTTFLLNMSHDIRTPINGIVGLLKIDEAHFDDAALIRANHEKMMISADHLLSLINDVLQVSRLEAGETVLTHEFISLLDLTRDIVTIIVGRASEAGIEWDYEKGKSIIPHPYIYGSPLHLRQIFLNIYGNCIKYNHAGGKITTIVDSVDGQEGMCTYRWTITDTGKGMSREFLEHIFEPFAQESSDARSVYQGAGLGMTIVKRLVEKMDGTIEIKSEEGVGSTFVITIPFEIAPPPSQLPAQAPAEKGDIRGMRLLLAEDNELNAEIAQTLLTDEGAEVTCVSNGREAVARFQDCPPGSFDAILMDVRMPVMDGLAATKIIRGLERPDAESVPIIAVTANAFDEDAQKCLEVGMDAHLAKPLEMEKVVATITRCCRRNGMLGRSRWAAAGAQQDKKA